jgi:[ribosomal protein S5]-alanine N-acetyltransferase
MSSVEIVPAHAGRELTARALPRVALVIAHTLPIENASCQVLRRCGYRRAGEVIDPQDGLVWRWQRPTVASSGR